MALQETTLYPYPTQIGIPQIGIQQMPYIPDNNFLAASLMSSFVPGSSIGNLEGMLIARGTRGSGIKNRPPGFGVEEQIPAVLKTTPNEEKASGTKKRSGNYTTDEIKENRKKNPFAGSNSNEDQDLEDLIKKAQLFAAMYPQQTFKDYMGGMTFDEYLKKMKTFGEESMGFSAGLGQLGAGISSIANAPGLVGQSALQAARDMGDLTIANMGAMAAQNRVMEANPTKSRFAGRYFR